MFTVSVIIPLYNAEKFISKTLESCLQLPEVKEVLVIDDAYPDKARSIVEEYAAQHPFIKIFEHPNHENRGAGASRNVGIKNATQDYIAFLDADDFYLSNRFIKDKEVFSKHPDAAGCYNALGVHFYTDKAKEVYTKHFDHPTLTTVNKTVNPTPDNLLEGLLGNIRGYGYFSLDALTLKRGELVETKLLFNEELRVHEDTDFIIKLAYYLKLYPAEIENAIAKRGVHEENRITANYEAQLSKQYKNRYKQWNSVYQWALTENFQKQDLQSIKDRLDFYHLIIRYPHPTPKALYKEIRKNPLILKNSRYGSIHKHFTLSLGKPVCYSLYAISKFIAFFIK